MSMLFSSYHDNEGDDYSGIMASRMRSSLEEDWGPVDQERQPRQRRRPRVITRRRRRVEEE